MLGSSIILFTIAVVFMRNQIRPIHKLAAVAERLGKGRDIGNFKPEGSREVRSAGRAFLTMQERIKRQVEQRTTMLAGISHDLKTPLTRMKLGLAFLPEGEDRKALEGDVNDMERMISSYLDFVRGEGEEQSERIPLRALLDKICTQTIRHGKMAHINLMQDIEITIRPLAFERALQNFIGNAERYATDIFISAERQEDMIEITIEDNGVGIDPKYYDDVFRPFFRIDPSRNASTGGVGLGMPIAQDIIHAHGGEVRLDKSLHGGLKVIIRLPI
jgi:two-component system osmolarity sensor histidine kinase EnvZ